MLPSQIREMTCVSKTNFGRRSAIPKAYAVAEQKGCWRNISIALIDRVLSAIALVNKPINWLRMSRWDVLQGLEAWPQVLRRLKMTHRTFSQVTAVLFFLVALLHAVRLLRGWQVTIDGAVMPIWISWIGLAIAAYLAYQGFLLSKTPTK
jgi:uncharacterized membrane protein